MTKTVEYNNIGVMVNGKKVDLKDANGNTVEPFMIGGTNYLPVRAVGEALGAKVSWNSESKTVVISKSSEADIRNSMERMGFYFAVDHALEKVHDVFTQFIDMKMIGVYVDGKAVSEDGRTMATIMKSSLKNDLEYVESMYSACADDMLLQYSDPQLMKEYRRLETLAYNQIDELSKSPTSAYINGVNSDSYKNSSAAFDARTQAVTLYDKEYAKAMNK
jgi:hypothetical protein